MARIDEADLREENSHYYMEDQDGEKGAMKGAGRLMQIQLACMESTAHGLPRIAASGKPVYVRVAWLLMFLLFTAFFIRNLMGLVAKLQNPQTSSSLEASSVRFQFPDIYGCFENPVSATYAASMDAGTARELDARLNDTEATFDSYPSFSRTLLPDSVPAEIKALYERNYLLGRLPYSFFYPHSVPYQLLIDALAHRAEQSVISSSVSYVDNSGLPSNLDVNYTSFYHPNYLRCFRWSLDAAVQDKVLNSGASGGLVLSLMLDSNSSTLVPVNGSTVATRVFSYFVTDPLMLLSNAYPVPLSEWSLKLQDWTLVDRRLGVRIFLTPPGEYPSDFTKSYMLAPGRFHVVDVSLTVNSYKPDQFDCLDSPAGVQFLNPYDQVPYSHEYSYSYCYYYEYHKLYQSSRYTAGLPSPLPWTLRNSHYSLNVTGRPSMLDVLWPDAVGNFSLPANISYFELAQNACRGRDRCNLLVYDASISSADWPTSASLNAYLGTAVATARAAAASRGLATPALDFLVANATSGAAAEYARSNLLKLQIRPRQVFCDRLSFSIGYGFESFIADVGGIMGIYLGMSLLTVCEIIELLVDLVRIGFETGDPGRRGRCCRVGQRPSSAAAVAPEEVSEVKSADSRF